MNDPIRVLVVEDRPAEATLIVAELHRPGVELEWKRVETESDYLVQLTRGWQIILAGDQVPQLAVVRALELLKARRLDIPFVVLTDGEYGYDDALNQGASDCVQRRFGRLGHVVRRELRNAAERQWRKTEVSVTKSVMERLLQSEVGGNPIYDILAEIKQAADFEAVGVRIRQGDDFPYYQTIGFPDVFVKSEESLCSRDSAGYPVRDEQGNHVMDCLCGDVLAGRFDPSSTFFTKGGSLWCNRTSQLPASMTAATSTPRRNVCVHMGYESLALIPLRRGDQIFGLMQFNDHRPDRFTLEMTEFFERLGSTIGIALDRQLKQEALLESREELLLALGGGGLGFWDWNLDTGRVRRHEGGSQTPGDALDVADCDVTQWMDDYHPDDRAAVWQCFEDHLDGRTANYSIECRIRAGGAGYRWIEERGAVVKRDAKGKPVRLTGVNIDISERRKTEAERIELEAQLRQAQKMESVGRLAGGVAHDFNNMLGLILGHAELAIEQVGQGQALREDLEEIRTAATRSAALTRQLLAFARKQTIAPKVLDLNETVTGVVAMLRRLVGEEIDIRWQPGVDLWPINMDPSQIEQMLANLSVNARDAIAGVGTLTIRTDNCGLGEEYCAGHPGCVPGQYVRLEVCDTGCGMDEHTRTQAFEPFFTTKEAGHGTGLGLSMVYGVVKQNNGFVDLVSAPGLGTTFSIYLPRYVGASEEVEVVGGLRPARPGHATILLVEDEKPFLAVTKRVLERWGYTVLAAGTPAHAMRLAEAHGGEIDLLLTDVVMPEMNGETLSRTLLSRHPHLKCLFMSGYTADVLSRHGVMEGTTNFIQKPFTMEMMAAKLRETLGMDPD